MTDLDGKLNQDQLEALYQSLRENEDHEEYERRKIFNKTQQKENNQINEQKRYLKSGY